VPETTPASPREELRPRGRWALLVAAACALRVAIPLAALAAAGRALPGLPTYTFVATPGDAQGFYSAARDFVAAPNRLGPALAGAVALGLLAAAVGAVVLARRGRRDLALALVAVAVALAIAVGITRTSHHTGAAVFGWSLLWSLPMFVLRAVGIEFGPRVGFALGLPLELLAIVTTAVCTWLIGLRATGRRSIAGIAIVLYAVWPLVSRLVAGPGAWENGSWNVDVGLHLYDEPISAALVAAAVVLLLAPRLEPLPLTAAGVLLSFSVAVRLSNAVLAALALGVVAYRVGPRRTLPLVAGLATFVPVVAAWWPRGYAALFDSPVWPRHPFAFSHVVPAWTDSLLFTPRALGILVPLAAIGVLAIRTGAGRVLVAGVVVVTAVFYSFYALTALHPRFLYVAFPELFTLWAGGAVLVVTFARGRVGRPQLEPRDAARGQT
jgi:hypothetical protein